MSDLTSDFLGRSFLGAVETHSVDELRAVFDAGLDPRATMQGKPLTTWLTEMYSRSNAFADCMRFLLERGATLDDPALAPVLLNDVAGLQAALAVDPNLLAHRTTLRSAFTPLDGHTHDYATLLHVAAEFGHLEVVRVLLEAGADVNARAGFDADGLGGQTPLFHTVNSNKNRSAPVMELLLDAGARGCAGCRPHLGPRLRLGNDVFRSDADFIRATRVLAANASQGGRHRDERETFAESSGTSSAGVRECTESVFERLV